MTIPSNLNTLRLNHKDVAKNSDNSVILTKDSRKRNTWNLFVQGKFVMEMRHARAMSFLDGWTLSSEFSKPTAKAIGVFSQGDNNPPQK